MTLPSVYFHPFVLYKYSSQNCADKISYRMTCTGVQTLIFGMPMTLADKNLLSRFLFSLENKSWFSCVVEFLFLSTPTFSFWGTSSSPHFGGSGKTWCCILYFCYLCTTQLSLSQQETRCQIPVESFIMPSRATIDSVVGVGLLYSTQL